MLALYGTIGRTILSLFFRVEKRRCPSRDYSLLSCPTAARTLLITPRGLSTARCTIAGREVKVERFTLKCILITYYQRVSDGRKEEIQVE